MKRLTWKRQARERGLRGVAQGVLGWDLRFGGEGVASVRPHYEGFSRNILGWYWVARNDFPPVPLRNTSSEPVPSVEEAKAACEAYVRAYLGLPQKKEW